MRPQFSIVSAVYNVSEYLPAYLASLDRQTYGVQNLQIVLVDDGSTDGSDELLRQWAATTAADVTVMRQENAGQGSARNAGIEIATGEWVTFADPDDVLADDYFAEVAAFLDEAKGTPDVIATRQLIFSDDHEVWADRHPLRRRFRKNEIVDLSRFPNRIQLSGCSAFLPLDRLKMTGLRFETRIRPTFEDGHLIGRHLLESRTPRVAFLSSAEYFYRRRQDGTSSVQAAWARADKYTQVTRHGYLDLLQRAAKKYGRPPVWVQNTVLYDLLWYFRTDARVTAATGAIAPAVLAEFHALCEEIFDLIDVETILGFQIVRTDHWLRRALVTGYKNTEARPDYVTIDSLDPAQKLVRARYTYGGERPQEAFYWRGLAIEPAHEKIRAVELLGRVLLHERIVWLPSDGTLRITLDGRSVPLSTTGAVDLPYQLTPLKMLESLGEAVPAKTEEPQGGRFARLRGRVTAPFRMLMATVRAWFSAERWVARATRAVAGSGVVRRRYADAWVLMDRQNQAQDNAEHLYRYLKRKRPEVNAWFVLDRSSGDWDRLRNDGFRLVPYGSLQWRALLLNARHVVSSHANAFVIAPLPRRLYGKPTWRFTFLQHGITKDDLSRWLNPKPIDLIVTSTAAETQSFSGDGTGYRYTTREIKQTGFPRHDALLNRAKKLAPADVNRILVMPTWRRALTEGLPASTTAEERIAIVRDSEYVQRWFAALSSPELKEYAEQAGCRLTFLPHPNMAAYLEPGDLPAHVEVLSWDSINVQDVFARTRLLLSDYSSVAFEVAMLQRPVIYYQFDEAEFFSGAQPYRRGYFDYRQNGFGPVVETHEELVAAFGRIAENGFAPEAEYARRITETFGTPTADACYRTYKAISQLDRPLRSRVVGDPAAEVVAQDVLPEDLPNGPERPEEVLTGVPLAAQELV
jgi:glycosyltransferase involved in cell wall biosynthesis/CDP-glycerol glycerophosphotransferase (TagB/SpsB family)